MDLGIEGRRAIVCASSRGLGKACALSLARNGVHVTLNGRDESVLAVTAEEIAKAAPKVEVKVVAGSISDRQCQQNLLEATPEADILINNNGGPPFRDFRELDRDKLIEGGIMNLLSPIEMVTAVIYLMFEREVVRIVNISSISGNIGQSGVRAVYNASKGAVILLTRNSTSVIRICISHNFCNTNLVIHIL